MVSCSILGTVAHKQRLNNVWMSGKKLITGGLDLMRQARAHDE